MAGRIFRYSYLSGRVRPVGIPFEAPVIEQRVVFSGTGRWKLACGPILLEASNGLLCVWLSGGDGEPAPGNCVLITRLSDRGRTWETDIPNPTTLATLICLPSGRIALVHNATGQESVFGVRNPLSIWVSDDELRTWSICKDVIATSGNLRPATWPDGLDQLAYPNAIILDGRLVFVYDRNRRDVMFVETNLR